MESRYWQFNIYTDSRLQSPCMLASAQGATEAAARAIIRRELKLIPASLCIGALISVRSKHPDLPDLDRLSTSSTAIMLYKLERGPQY
jgi:hypothetical protein